jgi:hypothetical protein
MRSPVAVIGDKALNPAEAVICPVPPKDMGTVVNAMLGVCPPELVTGVVAVTEVTGVGKSEDTVIIPRLLVTDIPDPGSKLRAPTIVLRDVTPVPDTLILPSGLTKRALPVLPWTVTFPPVELVLTRDIMLSPI